MQIIEPRPRLELGALAFGCMVVGSELLAIKTTMNEKDFIWAILKDAGINSLVHMPSRPVVITQADLSVVKPAGSFPSKHVKLAACLV